MKRGNDGLLIQQILGCLRRRVRHSRGGLFGSQFLALSKWWLTAEAVAPERNLGSFRSPFPHALGAAGAAVLKRSGAAPQGSDQKTDKQEEFQANGTTHDTDTLGGFRRGFLICAAMRCLKSRDVD